MTTITSRISLAFAVGAILATASARARQTSPAATKETPRAVHAPILEGYPGRIQARIEQQRRAMRSVNPSSTGLSPRFVLNLSKRWRIGQVVRVSFRGGNSPLHKDIADTVSEWMKYANITLDFGLNQATGEYRTWSMSDTVFTSEVRVSFDQSGYYSLVANDSINPAVTRPGEESLNLEAFDIARPSDWQAVALHEFGHAIGFEHEHQSPLAPCDFRFDDDPGYVPTTDPGTGSFVPDASGKRPGLYTFLGGPPNNWPQTTVDFNLKQMQESHAFEVGPFDKDSIMKYFFPDWMFISGMQSHCYTGGENPVISDGDKAGAAKVYPRAAQNISAASALRRTVLEEISKASALSAAARTHIQQELEKIKSP